MKRKELEDLWFEIAFTDPKEFEARLIRAYRERDGQFLSSVVQTWSLKPRKRFPLSARVAWAYEDLYKKVGSQAVTKKMIPIHIDPNSKIALRHFARAFREANLSWLPRDIPEKDF